MTDVTLGLKMRDNSFVPFNETKLAGRLTVTQSPDIFLAL